MNYCILKFLSIQRTFYFNSYSQHNKAHNCKIPPFLLLIQTLIKDILTSFIFPVGRKLLCLPKPVNLGAETELRRRHWLQVWVLCIGCVSCSSCLGTSSRQSWEGSVGGRDQNGWDWWIHIAWLGKVGVMVTRVRIGRSRWRENRNWSDGE